MNPLERKPVREGDSRKWIPGSNLVTFQDLGEGRQEIKVHFRKRNEETGAIRELFPKEVNSVIVKLCDSSSQLVDKAILKMMKLLEL